MLDELVKNFISLVQAHPFVAFLASMCSLKLIEISPIKLSPFTWAKNKVRDMCTEFISDMSKETHEFFKSEIEKTNEKIAELGNELNKVKTDFNSFYEATNVEKILDMRREILNFADDIVSAGDKSHKSKKNYERILFTVYPRYEELIEKTHMTNNQVNDSVHFLLKKYHQCVENGTFNKFYGEEVMESDDNSDVEGMLVKAQHDALEKLKTYN